MASFPLRVRVCVDNVSAVSGIGVKSPGALSTSPHRLVHVD